MESINKEKLISIKDSLDKIAKEIKKDRIDLYNELSEICEEIDSLFSDNDDYSWPMSFDNVRNNFGLTISQVRNHKRNYLTEGKDCLTERRGPHSTIYFERSGVIKILKHARTEKGTKYLEKYGLSFSPKEEHLYIDTIRHAMSGFENPTKEHHIKTLDKKYKIDLYLQNVNLAIECDEHDHYNQEYSDKLREREENIFKELGCKFLRFNPHELDFNVGGVINVIFHHICNKLINGKDPIDYYMEKRKKQRTIRERKYKLTAEELALFE